MHSIGVPDDCVYVGKLRVIIYEVKHGNVPFENGQAQLFASLFKEKRKCDIFPIGKEIFMCRIY